jgi:hypothetical protein
MRLFALSLHRFAVVVAIGLAVATASQSQAFAQQDLRARAPVLVTSLGQSLDAFQVQLAVRRAGIAYKYDVRAEPDQLAEAKTLFLAVGASLKGFGDALSNQLIEFTAPRAQQLIIRNDSDADGVFAAIAKKANIPLIVVDNVINLRQPLQELFAGG